MPELRRLKKEPRRPWKKLPPPSELIETCDIMFKYKE